MHESERLDQLAALHAFDPDRDIMGTISESLLASYTPQNRTPGTYEFDDPGAAVFRTNDKAGDDDGVYAKLDIKGDDWHYRHAETFDLPVEDDDIVETSLTGDILSFFDWLASTSDYMRHLVAEQMPLVSEFVASKQAA